MRQTRRSLAVVAVSLATLGAASCADRPQQDLRVDPQQNLGVDIVERAVWRLGGEGEHFGVRSLQFSSDNTTLMATGLKAVMQRGGGPLWKRSGEFRVFDVAEPIQDVSLELVQCLGHVGPGLPPIAPPGLEPGLF